VRLTGFKRDYFGPWKAKLLILSHVVYINSFKKLDSEAAEGEREKKMKRREISFRSYSCITRRV